MKNDSVAVIIPAYKCSGTLPATLASIAAQTRKPDEILICDDGSPDETWAYLQSLGKSYQGIPLKVFRQKNAGAGAARNTCLANTKATYIAFLDADDSWLPTKLERSLAELQRTNATWVAHDFYAVNAHNQATLWTCADISKQRDFVNGGNVRAHYFYRGFIGILTVVMRRDALVKAGGFDAAHRYSLDWECWHAVLQANPGATFHLFAEPLARYTLSAGGLTSKAAARGTERESYLPRYAKTEAQATGRPTLLLALAAWAVIQIETLRVMRASHQPGQAFLWLTRSPFSLLMLLWKLAVGVAPRQNFLTADKNG